MATFIHKAMQLDTDRIIPLQAELFTDLLHNASCPCCNMALAPAKATEWAFNNIDKYTDVTNERNYLWYILGLTIEDHRMWEHLYQDIKQENRTDTLIKLVILMRKDLTVELTNLKDN